MQTANARLEYLRNILARSTVAPVVRSHVAAVCVPLLMERSRDEAMAMLDESLRLNPLNLDALRIRYGMIDASTPPAQHFAVLLSLLRSNPAQPEIIDELADAVGVGLGRDAIEWYSVALRLYPRLGREYPEGFVSDAGAARWRRARRDAGDAAVQLPQGPPQRRRGVVRQAAEGEVRRRQRHAAGGGGPRAALSQRVGGRRRPHRRP